MTSTADEDHTDPRDIDASLVARLVAGQFPEWASIPVTPVEFGGNDNRTFHCGPAMSVRLPSAGAYAVQVKKEHRWLPVLAPQLPLPIPTPLALGVPAHGYPWHWSIYRWIDGKTADIGRIDDLSAFATTLGRFLTALQQVDPADGPPPGRHNFFRGGPLETYDTETRNAIALLDDEVASKVTAIWEEALAQLWTGSPVWFHGDVSAGNLLTENGRLSAVIDFGCSGVGDPASDLAIAWTLLDDESRQAFRAALPNDTATWARGRGWALWKSLITITDANPHEYRAAAQRTLARIINEHEQSRR